MSKCKMNNKQKLEIVIEHLLQWVPDSKLGPASTEPTYASHLIKLPDDSFDGEDCAAAFAIAHAMAKRLPEGITIDTALCKLVQIDNFVVPPRNQFWKRDGYTKVACTDIRLTIAYTVDS